MNKITLVLALLCVGFINSQSSWKKMNSKNTSSKSELTFRKTQPKKFNLYSLNIENFKNELTQGARGIKKMITLPGYNGKISNYTLIEDSNFTEPVNEKYGFIKSYSIKGITDKTETGKVSIGTDGVHITIYSGKHPTFYVDPYTKDNATYISYDRNNIQNTSNDFHCLFDEEEVKKEIEHDIQHRTPDDGMLRTYRLALACTGEYAQFHVNSQGVSTGTDAQKRAAVLSAMNTTMARVNGVYEKELAVKMNIVLTNGNNPLIFLDPATDNLSNDSAGTLINESQTVCDNIVGSANYDIGHTFSTGGGGLAGLGVVCRDFQKGKGITGTGNPIGDPYDIDFVAHEIGHQFGGPHTFNNSCNNNRSSANAVEPGSGSTIMAYAGICPDNVQTNSDDYFHSFSITSMWDYIQSTSCATTTNTGNATPVANAGADVNVPKSTPLVLRGSATDADGTAGLTYCWEQIDNEIATMPPRSANTGGPLFRSLSPANSPDRYLPALPTVIGGLTFTTWEVIPAVAREMNFSLLVRDNNAGGAASDRDDLKITVTDADPFLVTAPAAAVVWTTGTQQTIAWDKSTTDQAPINCQNVRIKLSTDGGLTFPITLVESTPNDGSHQISVPNNPTLSARIMVEAIGNIFYNVNSTNFTINSTVPTFIMNNNTNQQTVCNSGNNTVDYTLNFDFVNGFSETVNLSATGLPSGAVASFNPTTINADGDVIMTISNLDGVNQQEYTIVVEGQSTSITQTTDAFLKVIGGNFGNITLTAPADNAMGVNIVPTFTWGADANATSYDITVASDAAFANVVINGNSNTNSYTPTAPLTGNTKYYWLVKPKNSCGEGANSSVSEFTTANPSYCASTFTDEAGGTEHITNVTFNTINNDSGNDTTDGYIDYTSITTDVTAGNEYPISVTFDAAGFQDHVYVYIDWNQDYTFDNDTELYDLGSGSGNINTRNSNITIPNNALNGSTRMRIIVQYFDGTGFPLTAGACDANHASEWGETEDYTINVSNPTASINDVSFENFTLYPNPSNGNFNVSFKVLNSDKTTIKLFDIRGRLVENKAFRNTPATFSEEFNFNNLNAGLYLLQVENGNQKATRKIIIR